MWPTVEIISHKSWLCWVCDEIHLWWRSLYLKLPFQYFLCEACSCVGDLVLQDNMWPKRNRLRGIATSCIATRQHVNPRLAYAVCLPVVTLDVQTPRLRDQDDRRRVVRRWRRESGEEKVGDKKNQEKMGTKKFGRICLRSFLLFLFLAKSGEWIEYSSFVSRVRCCFGQRIYVGLVWAAIKLLGDSFKRPE